MQLGRLALQVDVFPPDARRRDLDNLFKSLLDALQHAGVIDDDNQFDVLAIRRQHRVRGGLVRLQINSHVTEKSSAPLIKNQSTKISEGIKNATGR